MPAGARARRPAARHALFGSLSPGTTGALDLYEVAGGYATTEQRRHRARPARRHAARRHARAIAAARRRRAPAPVDDPAVGVLPGQHAARHRRSRSTSASASTSRSSTQFAYAGYDGGLLCLTIGASSIAQLSTDTLALLSRSLGKLVESNSPMAIGLRPQSPPTITLGKNTFKDDGTGNRSLDEPLLDIRFTAMEIDFFASIDDQYVRVFTRRHRRPPADRPADRRDGRARRR